MKLSTFSGRYIYDEIKKAEKERDELAKALDMVADEMGKDSIPFKYLDKNFKDSQARLAALCQTEYTQVVVPTQPPTVNKGFFS